MSNISKAFEKGKVLIPFVTMGDPTIEESIEIIKSIAKNGADMIELGIAFSDPQAEAPAAQLSYARAIKGGCFVEQVFEMVKILRKEITIPFIFVTYANVVFSYGIDKFFADAATCNIDGIIIPDVPYEEKEEFQVPAESHGIDFISVIAPTSANRIEMIAKDACGFVYVSADAPEGTSEIVISDVKKHFKIPCVTSSSIVTPEQAKVAAKFSDGVVIPSAVLEKIGTIEENRALKIGEYIKEMKAAIS